MHSRNLQLFAHPGNGVQGVVKEVGVDLGLKRQILRLALAGARLRLGADQIVQLFSGLVKGVGDHQELFLILDRADIGEVALLKLADGVKNGLNGGDHVRRLGAVEDKRGQEGQQSHRENKEGRPCVGEPDIAHGGGVEQGPAG